MRQYMPLIIWYAFGAVCHFFLSLWFMKREKVVAKTHEKLIVAAVVGTLWLPLYLYHGVKDLVETLGRAFR